MNVDALLSLMAGAPTPEASLPTFVDAQDFTAALEAALGAAYPPGAAPPPWPLAEGERGESPTQWSNTASNEMDPIAAEILAAMQTPIVAPAPTQVVAPAVVHAPVIHVVSVEPAVATDKAEIQVVAGERIAYPEDALSRGANLPAPEKFVLPAAFVQTEQAPPPTSAPADAPIELKVKDGAPPTEAKTGEATKESPAKPELTPPAKTELADDAEKVDLSAKTESKISLEAKPPENSVDQPVAESRLEKADPQETREEATPVHQDAVKPEAKDQNPSHEQRREHGDRRESFHRLREVADDRREFLNIQRQGVRIELDVRDLGALSLDIEQSGGAISARLSTDNDQVRQALIAAQPQLTKSLDDKGLVIKDFTVNAGLGDAHQHSQPRDRESRPNMSFARQEVASEPKKLGFARSNQGLDLNA